MLDHHTNLYHTRAFATMPSLGVRVRFAKARDACAVLQLHMDLLSGWRGEHDRGVRWRERALASYKSPIHRLTAHRHLLAIVVSIDRPPWPRFDILHPRPSVDAAAIISGQGPVPMPTALLPFAFVNAVTVTPVNIEIYRPVVSRLRRRARQCACLTSHRGSSSALGHLSAGPAPIHR